MRHNTAYTPVAKGLHWLMAVLILGLLGVGLYMADLPLSPQKLQLYSWHKWLGVTVFLLLWLRLFWRVTHRPPELPRSMSPSQKGLAHAGHAVLYVLMLAVPVSGWLMSSAKGFQTVWWGIFPLPDLIEKNETWAEILGMAHWALNMILIFILLGHVGAALFHHFVLRDDILRRMTVGK